MTNPQEALGAFTKLMRAANSVQEFLRHRVPLPAELAGSGFAILEVLYHKGPLSQCDIGAKILKTTGNISQAIDKLEKRGLVLRKEGVDRRSHLVTLTPRGQELIGQVFPQMRDGITEAFGTLTPTELDTLSQLCKKLGMGLKG